MTDISRMSEARLSSERRMSLWYEYLYLSRE